MMQMEKLDKPLLCPFCGAKPLWNNSEHTFSIMCSDDNCPGRPGTDDYYKRINAIKAWNTRVEEDV